MLPVEGEGNVIERPSAVLSMSGGMFVVAPVPVGSRMVGPGGLGPTTAPAQGASVCASAPVGSRMVWAGGLCPTITPVHKGDVSPEYGLRAASPPAAGELAGILRGSYASVLGPTATDGSAGKGH